MPSEVLPVLIVSGLGRCGSSLMMQMLEAAGVATVGEFPDYEVEETNHRAVDLPWLTGKAGSAVKVLNPHVSLLPLEVPARVIWLDRDAREQARSQAKFVSLTLGVPFPDRSTLLGWERRLRAERSEALRALRGWPILALAYESLLLRPAETLDRVEAFLRPWWTVEPQRMAAAIRKKDARCASGLDMELALVRDADAAKSGKRVCS